MRWGAMVVVCLFLAPAVADAQRYRRYPRQQSKKRTTPTTPAVHSWWLDLEVGYRIGLGRPAGRLPEVIPDPAGGDSPDVWDRVGRTLTLEARAIVPRLPLTYATARYEGYHSTRAGASPRAITAGIGYARTFASAYKGGVARPTVTGPGAGPVDRWGRPCKPTYVDTYGRKIYPFGCRAALGGGNTRRGGPIAYGPGVAKGWAGVWAGWRTIDDFIQGADTDQANPLGSAGGPAIGVQGLVQGQLWLATLRHEFVYHAKGMPEGQGKLGYAGRIAGGIPWLVVQIDWRLDPGTGTEFTFGVAARLPLMR